MGTDKLFFLFIMILTFGTNSFGITLTRKEAYEVLKKNSNKWKQTQLFEKEAEGLETQAESADYFHSQLYVREFAGRVNLLKFGFNSPGDLSYFTFGSTSIIGEYYIYNGSSNERLKAAQINTKANKVLGQSYQSDLTYYLLMQYLNIQRFQKKLEVTQMNIEKSMDVLKLAQSKIRAGAGVNLDLLRAKSLVEFEKLKQLDIKTNLYKSKQELASFLGIDDLSKDFEILNYVDINLDSAKNIIQSAMNNRLDLKALTLSIEAADHFKKQFESSIFSPKISFLTEFGLVGSQVIGGFGNALTGTVGVQLEFNLFDGNLSNGQAQEWESKKLKSIYQSKQANLEINSQTKIIVEQINESKKAIETTQSQLKVATEEFRLATQRFRSGLASSLDIVNSKTSLALAQDLQIDALCTYEASRINYYKNMGMIEKIIE